MEVTLRQLRAFTALARTGGFTRAAESLHITQSALSGLIKELETQLGVRLVDRNTRRIQLSEVGREFHSVATRILRDLDGALENIDNLKRLRRGIVRIAAPQLMASTLIPEVIASFRREHPDIQVHLLDCAVENAITQAVPCPVIGIGGSAQCDGQVLVTEDMLGMFERVPRFVKRYAEVAGTIEQAAAHYAQEVRDRAFPGPEQTYQPK